MSAWGPALDALARQGDAAGLRETIDAAGGKLDQGDLNFAFQAACETGRLEAAKTLLDKTGIVSVSRGMRKACWRGSVECMALAMERLEREDAFDQLDLGVALRDCNVDSERGRQCAAMAWAKAGPTATAFALLHAIQGEHWETATWLALQGAPMDELTFDAQRLRSEIDARTPREAWEKKMASANQTVERLEASGKASAPESRRALRMAIFEDAVRRGPQPASEVQSTGRPRL